MKTVASSRGSSPVVVAAIVVVLAALVVGSYLMVTPGSALPPPSLLRGTFASARSASGLMLRLSLNATSLTPGQAISVTITERNTKGSVNDVQAARNWPMEELKLGPCGTLNDPMGVLIVQGNYSTSSVIDAQPLILYKPGFYSCPLVLADIVGYSFQPLSDDASVITGAGSGAAFNVTLSSTIGFKGYYGGDTISSTFTNFPAGVYTVVGGDEWGALTVLHFQVTSS